ncbi:MAG: lipocalin family protein, partial [Terriglobia bacterium]
RKAPGLGNASNYFSLTRLQTSGSVDLYGKRYRVVGTAWMDHEFFTGPSSSPVSGWNWFALQFNNNTELMLYQVRLKDGRVSPDSSGTYVAPSGGARHLDRNDFVITPGTSWTSPRTRARYPIQWQISVPPLHLQGQVSAPLRDQELVSKTRFSPTYWEGAVRFHGEAAGKAVSGVGYLEMTGYAPPADAPRKR